MTDAKVILLEMWKQKKLTYLTFYLDFIFLIWFWENSYFTIFWIFLVLTIGSMIASANSIGELEKRLEKIK